ncbi:hypothetical protein, partial [Thiolapillus sp.]|uniref:hypothetical protein n=1 Tax=Thiolapillus sp. TaxID=2017437 RepID=UPI0025DAC0F3
LWEYVERRAVAGGDFDKAIVLSKIHGPAAKGTAAHFVCLFENGASLMKAGIKDFALPSL